MSSLFGASALALAAPHRACESSQPYPQLPPVRIKPFRGHVHFTSPLLDAPQKFHGFAELDYNFRLICHDDEIGDTREYFTFYIGLSNRILYLQLTFIDKFCHYCDKDYRHLSGHLGRILTLKSIAVPVLFRTCRRRAFPCRCI